MTVTAKGLENTSVSVMIRLNGADYQNWSIDFSSGKARLVRDLWVHCAGIVQRADAAFANTIVGAARIVGSLRNPRKRNKWNSRD